VCRLLVDGLMLKTVGNIAYLTLIGLYIFAIFLMLPGCAFHRVTDITTTGKGIKSIYGDGNVEIKIKTETTGYIFQ